MIPPKRVILIDIWSYKVKTALCEYLNWEIKILKTSCKRQDPTDIISWEIANIVWVSNTIEKAIFQLLDWLKINPKDIIINIPTLNIISSNDKINYSRVDKYTQIDMQELDTIVSKAELQALNKARKEIIEKTWYIDVDLKLITSSITSITIDWLRVSNPMWFTWSQVSISTLNIFVPYSRYNLVQKISEYLNKNILSIAPIEFCIPKLFEKTQYAYDDIVFIEIWNSKTSVIVQKSWVIEGFNTYNLWTSDLIKLIKENTQTSKIDIINNLNKKDTYLKEKQEFLSIWQEWFFISVKDILKDKIIPHNIFISWWWNNEFIKDFIKELDISKQKLHTLKPFSFIDLQEFDFIDFNNNDSLKDKTNISLLSMILASRDIVNNKSNPIMKILKNFLEKNEY